MLNHDTPRDAAAISYFSLLALFPSALVLIAVVDAFLGWMNLHKLVVKTIVDLFPGSRSFLQSNLSELTDPSPALFLSCLGFVIWSATWILDFIEDGLNRAWDVKRKRSFLESRVRSLSLMVLGGLLLLASTGLTAMVSAAQSRSVAHISGRARAHIISWLSSSALLGCGFIIAILVFFFIYKLLPDRRVRWQEALSGAAASATLLEIASYIFAKLVPIFDYQKIYGKMGAIIALLAWVYTCSLITLFGANFSAQLHRSPIEQRSLFEKPARMPRQGGRRSSKIRAFPQKTKNAP